MKAKLVWCDSGDEIDIIPCRHDVFEFYVDRLDQDQRNRFDLHQTSVKPALLEQLNNDLLAVRRLESRGIQIAPKNDGDLLDQNYLNQIHHDWVMAHQQYPSLPTLLRSKHPLDKDFRSVNSTLHELEMMFSSCYINYDQDPYKAKQPFGADIFGFDSVNVMMGLDFLGRSSFNQWCIWDDLHDTDVSDQIMLSGKITINLNREWYQPAPLNYVEACRQANRPVLGKSANLGMFKNLAENLKDYRYLMLKNTKANNAVFFVYQ